ncbi:MAG: uroporphyrinogen-III synthase [Nitrososphaerota archaeon]|nr:uroporphyrinogen-III synthase [Nitrososphaerota archaeon]MDG6966571.1 uroporphyrinogen-III synthase [Nitrososphaerota archaeon]MDG6978570.1 uroporphyrinogen-III synthase [Nitrososphaerota archaeon]
MCPYTSGSGPSRTSRLDGMTVVVTASRRATEQSDLVSRLGGIPYLVPTVGVRLTDRDAQVEPFLRALTAPPGVDYAVFMTATGVRVLMLAANGLGVKGPLTESLNSPRVVVVARSAKPRLELAEQGIKVDAVPAREEPTALGVVGLLRRRGLRGKRVAVLWHGSRNQEALDGILEGGASEVFECFAYRYSKSQGEEGARVLGGMGFKPRGPEEARVLRLIGEIAGGTRRIDAVTFTSPPAASSLFETASQAGLEGDILRGLRERGIAVAAVGRSTQRELEARGAPVHVVPGVPAMGAMTVALAAYLGRAR